MPVSPDRELPTDEQPCQLTILAITGVRSAKCVLAYHLFVWFFAQVARASRAGCSAWPGEVRAYSTRGGTS